MKKIILLLFCFAALNTLAQVPGNYKGYYSLNYGSLQAKKDVTSDFMSNLQLAAGGFESVADRDGNEDYAIKLDNSCLLNTISKTSGGINYNNTTVSFWIKQEATASGSRILQWYGDYRGQGATGFRIQMSHTGDSTNLSYHASAYSNGNRRETSDAAKVAKLADNAWHHIVFRSTRVSNTELAFAVFIDGVEVAELSDNSLVMPGTIVDFIRQNSFQIAPLKGLDASIDDIYIYESALSDTQISALYNDVPPPPRRVYVNANASGANNGTSWTNAYTDLRNSFLNAQEGDEIWVAKGTYHRTGTDRNFSFAWTKDYVSIYGGFSGSETSLSQRDWRANETILSGDMDQDGDMSDNSYCVFVGPYGQTNSTILEYGYIDGLIFQDGNANSTGTAKYGRNGGGTFIESYVKNVAFENCTWRNNQAIAGGGISVSGEFQTKNVTFRNCKVINNVAQTGAPFDLSTYGKDVIVQYVGCLFADNEIKDLTTTGNYGHGGRIMAYSGGNIGTVFFNCTWAGNSDNSSSTDKILLATHRRFSGGAGAVEIHNCIFSDNQHQEKTIDYPRISNNGGIGINIANTLLEDINGVIVGDTAKITKGSALFQDASNGDYSLLAASPAIDQGESNISGIQFLNLVDYDNDLIGNDRITGSKTDLGCYEYQGTTSTSRIEVSEIKAYPNPTNGVISIDIDAPIISLKVLSVSGQEVIKYQNASKVDLSTIPEGVYILVAKTQNKKFTTRIIKQ